MVSGYPCAGKSHRSKQLLDYFNSRISSSSDPAHARLKVHIVNDENLGIKPNVYHTARSEKDARAAEMSAVKRLLNRDTIVIADGLNYIKGFRYQLYCEAKALQTPSCVVCSILHSP
jgi:protein KTI12